MTQLFTNNANTALAAGISNVATSMTVTPGDGAKFPSPTGSDFFYCTLFQLSGINEFNWEIVKVTARATDTFTIVRAQDGTAASAFNSGDKVSLRMTAAGAAGMAQTANNLADLANAATARTNLGLGTAATHPSTDFATAAQGTEADGAAQKASNLSDLASASTARTNLGLGTAATLASTAVAQTANNLSDLASAPTARTNLGLGTAATLASTAVAQTANNLSDLANAATARTNLGLGTAATTAATAYATSAQGTKADNAVQKDGSVAMTGGLEIDYPGGNSTGLNRALIMKSGVGAVDGKTWIWDLDNSGLDNVLHLGLVDDSGTFTQSVITLTRTGAVRKLITLHARTIVGSGADDAVSDLICSQLQASQQVNIGNITGSTAVQIGGLGLLADFGNATPANRFAVQSTTGTFTSFSVIPPASGVMSLIQLFGSPAMNNCAYADFRINSSTGAASFTTNILGTGTQVPLTFGAAGTEAFRVSVGGKLLVGGTTDDTVNAMQVTGSVKATGSIRPLATPSAAWSLDTGGAPVVVANGATYSFVAGSGLLVLNDQVGGSAAIFLVGGGLVTLVGQAGTAFVSGTPAAGKVGVDFSGGVYRINNNFGSSRTIGVFCVSTRNAA